MWITGSCMTDRVKGEEKGFPIMVLMDRRTKVIHARVIPHTGQHWYGMKVSTGIVESVGYKK